MNAEQLAFRLNAGRQIEPHYDPLHLDTVNRTLERMNIRRIISQGDSLMTAARMMVDCAIDKGIIMAEKQADEEPLIVAGLNVGGWLLAPAVACAAPGRFDVACAIDRTTQDIWNSYGVHGSKIYARRIMIVDDVVDRGSNLRSITDLIDEAGGIVTDAMVMVDKSDGKADEIMSDYQINFHAIFRYDSDKDMIVPAEGPCA